MQIVSSSPLPYSSVLWRSGAKGWNLTVLCKATFALAPGESKLAERQEAINDRDDHWDDDASRSLRAPSDLVPAKVRADVLLVGAAYAPQQVPVATLTTRLIVGDVDKSIEIIQDRWIRLDGSVLESSRFTRMPLVYERAGGGPDTSNPVGVRAGAVDSMGRVRLPNLLRPGQVIRGGGDVIEPTGFGPLAPSWPGRRDKLGQYAGSFSAARWYEAPLPEDLDYSFFNAAPRDQQLDYVPPNARVVLDNLHPTAPRFVTSLAGLQPAAIVEGRQGGAQTILLHGDTLWIDTERLLCTLTFRARIALRQPDEQGRVTLTWQQAAGGAAAAVELAPTFDGDDASESWATAEVSPAAPAAPPPDAQARYTALPFRPGGQGAPAAQATPGAAPPDSRDLRARNAGLPFPFQAPGGAPAEPIAGAPVIDASRSAPPPSSSMRPRPQQFQTLVFPEASGQGASPAPSTSAPALPSAVVAPRMAPPLPAPTPSAPPAAPAPPAPPAPVAAPPAVAPSLASSLLAAPAPVAVPIAPPSSEQQPGSAPAPARAAAAPPPPAWVPSSSPSTSGGWSPSPRSPEPGAPPTHDARAALGGISAASDAAAARPPVSADPAAAPQPAARPRQPPPSEYVDLLWFEERTPQRIRQQSAWVDYLRDPPRPSEWLKGEEPEAEPQVARDRREVARAMVRVPPLDAIGVARALEEGIDEDGILTRPLAVVAGELTLIFDPVESLKATLAVAAQLAATDKRLKDAIDAAAEVAQAPRAAASPLVEGASGRVRQAFAQVNRSFPSDYLEASVQRILLEDRRYLRRTLLGGPRLCASLATGSGSPLPTYLPDHLADKLPLFPRFRVRAVVEPHAQQDPTDTEPLALNVLALGRAVPVGGRSRAGRS